MNEHAILHIPDSRYCFAVSPREVVIRLRMAREETKRNVTLIYASKYEFTLKREKMPLTVTYRDRIFEYYEAHLKLSDVRLAYIFQIEEGGKRYYFSEDGVTETYCFEEGFYHFFQLPYINANDVMPVVEWMQSAVFYQIFVERFFMGDEGKDTSYINMEWGDLPTPKSFAGGDLPGVTQKLDYLCSLGVNALYLTPVFASISNHKYDIRDYYQVDRQFGGDEALLTLVEKAHSKGIRVVLDAVFNHCSMLSMEFQDVLEKGQASPYFDWFVIHGEKADVENCNYECFAACNYMPKYNTANEEVQKHLIDIALYWMKKADIDGWRLDVSDEVSHDFWRKFRRAVKAEKPDCVIIGENWHDAYPYLMGEQYDSIMNYAFTKACLDYFARGRLDARGMAEKLSGNYMRNMEQVNFMMMNLLDSHDTHRFFTETGCDRNRLIAAVALEMMYPGAPCLYYGTEIGMEGGYDPDSRRGFCWEESTWDKTIWKQVQRLTKLRQKKAAQYGGLALEEERGMLRVSRTLKGQQLVLYINFTGKAVQGFAQEAPVVAENLYENGVLEDCGYVIFEITG